MIVGFQIMLIGLLADVDLRHAQAASKTCSIASGAWSSGESPSATTDAHRRVPADERRALMADPHAVSVVIPAMNEAGGGRRGRPRAAPPPPRGTRSSSLTTGRSDDTAPQAQAAGARVIRHPYNKGNGAAVKAGIRAATGEYILIIDGDGQHQAGRRGAAHQPPRRIRPRRRRAIGARRRRARRAAGATRRSTGWPRFSPNATFPDLTSGFRAARRRDCSSSSACCRTASRRRRRRRCAFSRRATTWPSSRRGAASASARRRSGCRVTARSSC